MEKQTKKRLRPGINLTLDPKLVAQGKKAAKQEGRSLSSYIENLLREELDRLECIAKPTHVTIAGKDEIRNPKRRNTGEATG